MTYFPLYPSSSGECNASEYAGFCKRCKTVCDHFVVIKDFFFYFIFFMNRGVSEGVLA